MSVLKYDWKCVKTTIITIIFFKFKFFDEFFKYSDIYKDIQNKRETEELS